MASAAPEDAGIGVGRWLRRFGVGGFLFFFVKGIAWLVVPMLWMGWR